jgi:hypothetical protein
VRPKRKKLSSPTSSRLDTEIEEVVAQVRAEQEFR